MLVLAAGATVATVTEEVKGGSAGFPSAGGPPKLNAEETRGVLAGCAPLRLVEGALLAGFVESSAGPTRSPEKLPRVSPARELGKRSSPALDGAASNLLGGVERAIPGGAAGRLPGGAGSPAGAPAAPVVVGAAVTVEGDELSGVASDKGLPPPPNGNVSGWLDSLAGGAAPSKTKKLGDESDLAESDPAHLG